LIPSEFCLVRWMQLVSAQSIAIRGELVFTSHVVPRHFGPDAYTAWDDAQGNNARLFLEGTLRPESFYDVGGAIKSITCLSFRR
jgi:hypothetical protein